MTFGSGDIRGWLFSGIDVLMLDYAMFTLHLACSVFLLLYSREARFIQHLDIEYPLILSGEWTLFHVL